MQWPNNTDGTFEEALADFMNKYKRAYNLIFIYKGIIYTLRDPYGTRPLSIRTVYDNSVLLWQVKL